MKTLVIVSLLCVSRSAHADPAGYVDTLRVRSTATEPKRLDADFRADQGTRQQRINDAWAEAKKAHDRGAKQPDQDAAAATASRVQQENSTAIQKHAEEADVTFLKALTAILVKLRSDRHASITAGPAILLVPGVDLTDEVIRRWNAADAAGMAADLAKVRAENAALKAADKTTTKGTSP